MRLVIENKSKLTCKQAYSKALNIYCKCLINYGESKIFYTVEFDPIAYTVDVSKNGKLYKVTIYDGVEVDE